MGGTDDVGHESVGVERLPADHALVHGLLPRPQDLHDVLEADQRSFPEPA
jgi:hypothetical protein